MIAVFSMSFNIIFIARLLCWLSHVFRHGDAGLPELVAPVDAGEERHQARLAGVVLLLQRALLHPQSVADVVELELLAVGFRDVGPPVECIL